MNVMQVMEQIKLKEQHVKHLKAILERAKQDESPEVFLVHRELKAQEARGRELVDQYNAEVRKQNDLRAENEQMVKRFRDRETASMERTMLNAIIARYRWDLPEPSHL